MPQPAAPRSKPGHTLVSLALVAMLCEAFQNVSQNVLKRPDLRRSPLTVDNYCVLLVKDFSRAFHTVALYWGQAVGLGLPDDIPACIGGIMSLSVGTFRSDLVVALKTESARTQAFLGAQWRMKQR